MIFRVIVVLVSAGLIFLVWTKIPDLLFWWFSDWFSESTGTNADGLEAKGVFGDSFGGG